MREVILDLTDDINLDISVSPQAQLEPPVVKVLGPSDREGPLSDHVVISILLEDGSEWILPAAVVLLALRSQLLESQTGSVPGLVLRENEAN